MSPTMKDVMETANDSHLTMRKRIFKTGMSAQDMPVCKVCGRKPRRRVPIFAVIASELHAML